ncbi:hypothetical protein Ocin01_04477 [Orchesella cincta]|uniref:Uncharacterized protein n=1 Tax=Orchesella cincta TaxID=48709 RepID=A0A1D2NAE7_ORCCI|nr:hypothetical protein Ocin01_04477 [Orchesella cincta]
MYTNDARAQVRSSSQLTQAPPLDNALISPVGQPTTPAFEPTPAIPITPTKAPPTSRVPRKKRVTKSVPAPASTSGN